MPKFEVIIARKAEEDLAGIYRYIALSDGMEQAERIQERLINDILKLESLPARGKIPPEMLKLGIDDYREVQSSPWRIFYYVNGNTVGVVAILDGRRNVEELLQKRLLQ
jgi:toxin ParE1/3/4